MTTSRLSNALAAIRRLSPPVATTETTGGDSTRNGESQIPQGFDESVATVATVSTDFGSSPHFSPLPPARPALSGNTSHSVATGGDGGDSQQRRRIPLSPPPKSAVATVATAPPWTDDRAWCARIGSVGLAATRRAVLREWVEAAGGRHDAAAVNLPAALPRGVALATLKAHARGLGLAARDDAMGACEVKRLLAAGQRATNPDLANDPPS
ncbi:MAG: hypothetical protein AB7X49_22120 [Geminicoccaceae bacterium]